MKASPLAHPAEQAAAIIGGKCKASWLKAQARAGKIPGTKIGGAWHFTDAHISEIIRLSGKPAAPARKAPRAAAPEPRPRPGTPAPEPAPPAAAAGAAVLVLKPRAPRSRAARAAG